MTGWHFTAGLAIVCVFTRLRLYRVEKRLAAMQDELRQIHLAISNEAWRVERRVIELEQKDRVIP